MNRTVRVALAGALGIAVFLVLWEVLVRALDVRPFVLQAPTRILDELLDDPGLYLGEAWVTAWHALAGLAISLLVSLVIGSLLAMSRFAEDAAQPVLVLVLVTPWVAYFTSVVIWLGAGWRPVVFLVAFVTVPAFTFAMVAGLRSADPSARELLRSVDAARWEVLWRLRLPSAMPTVFAALRFNTGLALAAAYYGEGGNLSNAGLGAIGRRAAQSSQADVLWATIATTALLGIALLTAVTLVERAALRWHSSQQFDRITVR